MTMRRNDFKVIAEIIRQHKLVNNDNTEELLYDLERALTTYFRQINEAFDKRKFMKASGWYDV